MDDSTATSTTSIDEADTELQSRTLKGRRRPDIAHLSMFIRASKPIQAIEAGTTLNRSTRLSPELQKQERTDARGVIPLTTAAGMDFK
jgi:hypothetical protein